MLTILTAFMPWLSANGRAEASPAEGTAVFNPEGSTFPSYAVFRDVLSEQILKAGSRICILSPVFEDRELGLFVLGASQRALATAIRVNPRVKNESGRLQTVLDNLKFLGVPVQENALKSLKPADPTFIAIDRKAWAISVPLSETSAGSVEVEAAPWTSAEVCGWAGSAQSAKAATVR